jgi:DNA-directed RNA polymerase specialized sigma subunit
MLVKNVIRKLILNNRTITVDDIAETLHGQGLHVPSRMAIQHICNEFKGTLRFLDEQGLFNGYVPRREKHRRVHELSRKGMTQQQIAKELGITQPRVSQILNRKRV